MLDAGFREPGAIMPHRVSRAWCLERQLGPAYPPLRRLFDSIRLGRQLVGVDLGDIVTLFARKRTDGPSISTNGLH